VVGLYFLVTTFETIESLPELRIDPLGPLFFVKER
jgi:hypothetical protein